MSVPANISRAFPKGLADLRRTAPRKAELIRDLVFVSPTLGTIVAEAGFETDYASIPRIFWAIYPPDGAYTDAACIHDYLYWFQPCTRRQADTVFLEGMEALGIPWARRHVLHKAVRIGGWLAWRNNRRERLRNLPLEFSTPQDHEEATQ